MEWSQWSRQINNNIASLRQCFDTYWRETILVVRVLEGIEAEVVREGFEVGRGMHEQIWGNWAIQEVWEGIQVAMDGFWIHDALLANQELLHCFKEEDTAKYTQWFGMEKPLGGGGTIKDAMQK